MGPTNTSLVFNLYTTWHYTTRRSRFVYVNDRGTLFAGEALDAVAGIE